jgi:glucose-6-phosphate 1-dehydrogenase
MSPDTRPKAAIFIVFGIAGDLTWPKSVPALYNQFLENRQPKHFDKGITGESW